MISVEGLTKTYGPTRAVDNLTFTVKPGMVTGFLGPNGAGKSTTMRMMLGLDRPTAGKATINGRPYSELRDPLRQVGALLDAKWVHPNRSARSHLRWMAASNGIPASRVDEVLADVGLSAVAGKRAGGFSLGMSQRLGLAGALLGDPGVLLFDEPVNGLDPEGIVWIRKFIRALAQQGRTVLVSSHLLTEMSLTADHLVVIGQGRLIADCSVKEFTSRATQTVRVRSPQLEQLRAALAGAGLTSADAANGEAALTLDDVTTDQVGEIAAANAITLHELSSSTASLEEVFMSMTAGTVQYHGNTGPGGAPAPIGLTKPQAGAPGLVSPPPGQQGPPAFAPPPPGGPATGPNPYEYKPLGGAR
ncbi:ABC transporter ATP-binding protein [Williamsia sp. CHRR-6]|uniref:ABC transporter ATP-binding protein n=1 Tax=Williamsia sp. CHRR-6 TaxID=2835871 RepID=UPI001BDAEBFB|nr:ABC transporter ATP-binding protein [Williamsia sp. CHRR-6]MBT0567041.1 ABC transporter ATP-binding protein [Williamsia sp. CHRR-6]